jgi:hypothetical protein
MLYLFFWVIPGVGILYADVSKHPVSSIFIGGVSRTNLLTPPMKMEQTECSETSAHRIPTPGITQKKENNKGTALLSNYIVKFSIKVNHFVNFDLHNFGSSRLKMGGYNFR